LALPGFFYPRADLGQIFKTVKPEDLFEKFRCSVLKGPGLAWLGGSLDKSLLKQLSQKVGRRPASQSADFFSGNRLAVSNNSEHFQSRLGKSRFSDPPPKPLCHTSIFAG
jgi:hypothetical protein